MKRRKICVVTGSRADYGHLWSILDALRQDPGIELQLVATGMHFLKEHGLTYRAILKDGFRIDAKVDMGRFVNTEQGVTCAVGVAIQGFAGVFARKKPDLVVVLGDRYEILAAAIAAYIARIPIAHVHGGEITQGLIDEGIRHSITKMASLHFVAADVYARRVIQMGEEPRRVFCYGAPGLDVVHSMAFLSREELLDRLGLVVDNRPLAMITYHPVTLEKGSPVREIDCIIKALKRFKLQAVFTRANADPCGDLINQRIAAVCRRFPADYRMFDNLGQQLYYNCLKHFDLVIGNSSSGVIEAASFHIPVVNIGDRQKNREHSANMIDVPCALEPVARGIRRALSTDFRRKCHGVVSIYDRKADGRIGWRIKETLKMVRIEGLIRKSFCDIPAGVLR